MKIKDFELKEKDSKLFSFDYAEKHDDGYILEVAWVEDDKRVYDLLGFPVDDFDFTYLDLYYNAKKKSDGMNLIAYGVDDMGDKDLVTKVKYQLHNTKWLKDKAKRFLNRIDYI